MKITPAIFSASMKLSEVLDSSPKLLRVFSRLGVGFGFGERTVESVCLDYGLDAGTVMLMCNVYTYPAYKPSPREISQGHVLDVVRFLGNSHSYYLETALPLVEKTVGEVIEPCNGRLKTVIWNFFNGYKAELEKHFAYEEGTVFPYIRDMVTGRSRRTSVPDDMEGNHGAVREKLSDLKNILMKALPQECDNDRLASLLSFIYFLQEDLDGHARIEDEVVAPMARYLEKPRDFTQSQTPRTGESGELTEREKEILVSVARGLINKEIADRFNISVHTVISHRKNISRKTGIRTVAGLTVYALLNGMIDTEEMG
ncbi:MAG: helix-turn-helix transcriptional regulator [Bacteroidales bacterium]|nr:helix-turn-helix transcriptional regulator [Bacteroidales bacterium]